MERKSVHLTSVCEAPQWLFLSADGNSKTAYVRGDYFDDAQKEIIILKKCLHELQESVEAVRGTVPCHDDSMAIDMDSPLVDGLVLTSLGPGVLAATVYREYEERKRLQRTLEELDKTAIHLLTNHAVIEKPTPPEIVVMREDQVVPPR